MTRFFRSLDAEALHKLQQTIKWIVYALLIVNFVFYWSLSKST